MEESKQNQELTAEDAQRKINDLKESLEAAGVGGLLDSFLEAEVLEVNRVLSSKQPDLGTFLSRLKGTLFIYVPVKQLPLGLIRTRDTNRILGVFEDFFRRWQDEICSGK